MDILLGLVVGIPFLGMLIVAFVRRNAPDARTELRQTLKAYGLQVRR